MSTLAARGVGAPRNNDAGHGLKSAVTVDSGAVAALKEQKAALVSMEFAFAIPPRLEGPPRAKPAADTHRYVWDLAGLELREVSPAIGKGVFATRPIRAGLLFPYIGRRVMHGEPSLRGGGNDEYVWTDEDPQDRAAAAIDGHPEKPPCDVLGACIGSFVNEVSHGERGARYNCHAVHLSTALLERARMEPYVAGAEVSTMWYLVYRDIAIGEQLRVWYGEVGYDSVRKKKGYRAARPTDDAVRRGAALAAQTWVGQPGWVSRIMFAEAASLAEAMGGVPSTRIVRGVPDMDDKENYINRTVVHTFICGNLKEEFQVYRWYRGMITGVTRAGRFNVLCSDGETVALDLDMRTYVSMPEEESPLSARSWFLVYDEGPPPRPPAPARGPR